MNKTDIPVTPVKDRWHIYNGAVYCQEKKVGAVVLATDPQGVLRLLVIAYAGDDRFAYVPLDQPKLETIIFGLLSLMTGEYYQDENGDLQRTADDHIWVDTISSWFYYSDEADGITGPYWHRGEAKDALAAYVRHNLSERPKLVSGGSTGDAPPQLKR